MDGVAFRNLVSFLRDETQRLHVWFCLEVVVALVVNEVGEYFEQTKNHVCEERNRNKFECEMKSTTCLRQTVL